MKSIEDIRSAITRRLASTWQVDVAGSGSSWPHEFPVGQVSSAELASDFGAANRRVAELRDWAVSSGLEVRSRSRRVQGTRQEMPTHVKVADLYLASAVAGPEWVARVERNKERTTVLAKRFPALPDRARFLRSTDGYTDLDFGLLLTVADWFGANTADGLTPRQVPVPGVHAKWLNTHGPDVETLLGRPLGLAPRHPARIHFTYVDPGHLAGGGRRFDSASAGDAMRPAYQPDIVLITENKDTAIHFPPVCGAIAVEGDGFGGKTAAAFPWITQAVRLFYWGDLDADAFEILDGFRRDGVPAASILMDLNTYETYATWGTRLMPSGALIAPREPKELSTLTEDERAAYQVLCQPPDGWPPRIEQERIPLAVAHRALLDACSVAADT